MLTLSYPVEFTILFYIPGLFWYFTRKAQRLIIKKSSDRFLTINRFSIVYTACSQFGLSCGSSRGGSNLHGRPIWMVIYFICWQLLEFHLLYSSWWLVEDHQPRLHTILTVTLYTVPSIALQHSQSKLQEFHLCLLDGNSCTIMLN